MSDVACNGGVRAREASAQENRFLARPWGRGGPGLRPRPPSQAPGSGCGGLGGEAAWTGLSGGFTRCLGAGGSCSRPPSSTVQVPTPHQPCSDLWLCLRVLGFTDPPSLGPCHLRSEAGPAGALSKQAPRAHRQRRGQPSACGQRLKHRGVCSGADGLGQAVPHWPGVMGEDRTAAVRGAGPRPEHPCRSRLHPVVRHPPSVSAAPSDGHFLAAGGGATVPLLRPS